VDPDMIIKLDPFFKQYIPSQIKPEISPNDPIDVLNKDNDLKFHQHLVSILKEKNDFFFLQMERLQT
jgi:hypothetical protein